MGELSADASSVQARCRTVFLTTFLPPFFGASSFLPNPNSMTGEVGATVGARTALEAMADGFTNPWHLVQAWHAVSAVREDSCGSFKVCAMRGLTRRRAR